MLEPTPRTGTCPRGAAPPGPRPSGDPRRRGRRSEDDEPARGVWHEVLGAREDHAVVDAGVLDEGARRLARHADDAVRSARAPLRQQRREDDGRLGPRGEDEHRGVAEVGVLGGPSVVGARAGRHDARCRRREDEALHQVGGRVHDAQDGVVRDGRRLARYRVRAVRGRQIHEVPVVDGHDVLSVAVCHEHLVCDAVVQADLEVLCQRA